MILTIHDRLSITLLEPRDFKRFHVEAALERAALKRASDELAAQGVSFETDDVAWVKVTALQALSGLDSDADWQRQFASMLAYCATKEWLSADGSAVRAHVVWT